MSRQTNVMCKRTHYHVRKGNGKLRWQRYYAYHWAVDLAMAYQGEFYGTNARADYCLWCLEIKLERKRVG